MQLPVQSFTAFMQQMAAAVQGGAAQLVDLTVGSVLRALLEAAASVVLWLQWLIVQVLGATRAATSTGADLDSWMADYSLYRLPATVATGTATFSRFSAGVTALIPVGCIVRTADGIQFAVTAQTENAAWNGNNGYILAQNIGAIDLPIQAISAGSGSNVQPSTITIIASPVAGIDSVVNQQSLSGGIDAESDAAFRQRFILYINSRSLGTKEAILFAVASVQPALRYVVLENQDISGNFLPGNFCVIVDDGSGSPNVTLLSAVQAAVEVVRPIGSTYSTFAPDTINANINLSVRTTNTASGPNIAASIASEIAAWVAELPIGGALSLSKIEAIAHEADPSVQTVLDATINGIASDLIAGPTGVILAGNIVVS